MYCTALVQSYSLYHEMKINFIPRADHSCLLIGNDLLKKKIKKNTLNPIGMNSDKHE